MGVGRIHKHSKDSQYRVDSIEELQVIDHFDKYPLMTKAPDYALFKKAFNLIKAGEQKVKASLNLGLNLSLREAFPDVVVVNKGPLPL